MANQHSIRVVLDRITLAEGISILSAVIIGAIAAVRLGYSSYFQLGSWEYSFDASAILISSVLTIAIIAWSGSLLLFLAASFLHVKRAVPYASAALIIFLTSIPVLRWTNSVAILRGDFSSFVSTTGLISLFSFGGAIMGIGIRRTLAEVSQTTLWMRRWALGALAASLLWINYVSTAVRPWWHGMVAGMAMVAFFVAFITIASARHNFVLYKKDSPIGKRMGAGPAYFLVSILILLVAIGTTFVREPNRASNGLSTVVGILAIVALGIWFLLTFEGPRSVLAQTLPPPILAISVLASLVILGVYVAAYYDGKGIAMQSQASMVSPPSAIYFGVESHWVCITSLGAIKSPRPSEPALLLATHEGAFVVWSTQSGTRRIPTEISLLTSAKSGTPCT